MRHSYFVTGHAGGSEARKEAFYDDVPDEVRRLVPIIDAINDPRVIADENVRRNCRELVRQYESDHGITNYEHCAFIRIAGLPPITNGCAFMYDKRSFYKSDQRPETAAEFVKVVDRNQGMVLAGGTSVGIALQLAVVMGTAKIDIYGVPFSNQKKGDEKPKNYDPQLKLSEQSYGETVLLQQTFLEALIRRARELGIPTAIHGATILRP